MHIFRRFHPRVIVPVDSTISEPFVLRCLKNTVCSPRRKWYNPWHSTGSPEYLTFALKSLLAAQQCDRTTHNEHAILSNSDTLLDLLIPIIHHKCDVPSLQYKLRHCAMKGSCNPSCGTELHGEDKFSLCTVLAATHIVQEINIAQLNEVSDGNEL